MSVAAMGQSYSAPEKVFTKVFGGSSGWDLATSAATDSEGNVVVVGATDSPDFPVTQGAYQPVISGQPLIQSLDGRMVTYPNLGPAVDVTAMAASADGAVLYVASSSGIFRSADNGATWVQQMPGLAGATSLAVDGGDPETLYAAIAIQFATTVTPGFYKSTDGGHNWSPLTHLGFYYQTSQMPVLTTSPGISSTIYDENGVLLRSRDGGGTWVAIGPHAYNVYDFALAPSDPRRVYTVASDGVLYRSDDGGDTWTPAGAHFSGHYPGADPTDYAGSMAIDPQNENVVWLLVNGQNLFRSTDAGATFQIVLASTEGYLQHVVLGSSGRILKGGNGSAWVSVDGGATWRQFVTGRAVNTVFATATAFYVGTSASVDTFVTKWSADGSHVIFSTFLGPGAVNESLVAVDASDNIYVISGTGVVNQPKLVKLSPAGNRQFFIPLPFTNPQGITTDTAGNVYVLGVPPPGPNGGCEGTPAVPVTVAKFDSQGNTVYSSTLDDPCVTGASGIAVDSSGQVYIVGSTFLQELTPSPTAVQTSPGGGVLLRLSPDGSTVTYATYLGDKFSGAYSVAVDEEDNIFVAGAVAQFPAPIVASADFTSPAVSCIGDTARHAFVMKLRADQATPIWLTQWGDCAASAGQVAIDSQGNVWAGGQTFSSEFPTVAPLAVEGNSRAFLTELSPDGHRILFSSYVPGQFALGPGSAVYLAGFTVPTPHKLDTSQIVTGLAVAATSALLEKLDSSATQPAVIDSIRTFNTDRYTLDPEALGVLPGELIRITGRGLGPATAAGAQIDADGRVAASLAGTRVLFDGVPAPLISVQTNEIVCMTPFELIGEKSTMVQIERDGDTQPSVKAGVGGYSETLAIANQDGTANSQTNPAHWGETVVFYVSGFGQSDPPFLDGEIYPGAFPQKALQGGVDGTVTYEGPAPGQVAGIWQVNYRLDATNPGVKVNPVPLEFGSVWIAP